MTREQKLALLIGFALVLVVGVVVSDHLSGAGQATLAGVTADAGEPEHLPWETALPSNQPLQPYAARPEPRYETPPIQPPAAAAPLTNGVTASADTGGGSLDQLAQWTSPLIDRISNGMDTVRNQLSEAPVAAQTDSTLPEPLIIDLENALKGQSSARSPMTTANRPSAPVRTHIVEEGESLWGIAAEHYGDGSLYAKLAEYNKGRVAPDGGVYAGATLLIPDRADLGAPPAAQTRVEAPKREPAKPAEQPLRRYTVQKGDTLGEIASRLLGSAKRWPEIVKANADVIDDPDNVPAGVVLKIPAK
ncbi:MAG: LysM peptidoglycan-binding domain-containing protein [Planctomycetota bacterium]|nr:LysM peptidoglycan-binding domain-containing protein [Planctomycetota bacterium]